MFFWNSLAFSVIHIVQYYINLVSVIKDRNGMELTEAEEVARIHRRTIQNHDQDNHDGVITHLEPDILECEVKWALESILGHQ